MFWTVELSRKWRVKFLFHQRRNSYIWNGLGINFDCEDLGKFVPCRTVLKDLTVCLYGCCIQTVYLGVCAYSREQSNEIMFYTGSFVSCLSDVFQTRASLISVVVFWYIRVHCNVHALSRCYHFFSRSTLKQLSVHQLKTKMLYHVVVKIFVNILFYNTL